MTESSVTTGWAGLDDILGGLRLGDNVVFRVTDVAEYQAFVTPYVRAALEQGRRLVYIRFGQHPPLLGPDDAITYDLDAHRGFESFTVRLHTIIEIEGPGVFYVFDCLSDLLDAWATDSMIANFFVVTCPYLYRLDTVAYFGLLRDRHSAHTVGRIRAITQLLLDVRSLGEEHYLHPMKVDGRSSHTLFLPHRLVDSTFVPLTSSLDATTLTTRLRRIEGSRPAPLLDYWDRLVMRAQELSEGPDNESAKSAMVEQLCRVLIANEERMLALALANFTLSDLLEITDRQIGTGFIGGKAVGMLLARKILARDTNRDWDQILEPHDSWYVGADVFYSFIVHNGWWPLFQALRETDDSSAHAASVLREKMSTGEFPADLQDEFRDMLEYYGQYPVIVRSSSLQEDGFGNAFAGKYDSVFLVGQGSPEERYERFVTAIRAVYASAISEDALAYRRHRGLDRKEEQMALLVQRVSGGYHEQYFFPTLAGVAISYNMFVWNPKLDPAAGMMRLVAGLGTRAVDRVSGDYPRIVSLDWPMLVPHAGESDGHRFTQHNLDVLDVSGNRLTAIPLRQVAGRLPDVPWTMLATEEWVPGPGRDRRPVPRWTLTFDRLLGHTEFPELMRELLGCLAAAYNYPVDVEFTAHPEEGRLRINIVQCRPLQTRGLAGRRVAITADVPETDILIRSTGYFMGGSVVQPLQRVVLVDPIGYLQAPLARKHEVGRVVGRLNRAIRNRDEVPAMLLGPGRWGTTTPALGVPVRFAEISNYAVLGEIAVAEGGLVPELSFGSHFFQDLVESGIFYLAVFPDKPEYTWNVAMLNDQPNLLAEILPGDAGSADLVKVVDLPGGGLVLEADIVSQQLLCRRAGGVG